MSLYYLVAYNGLRPGALAQVCGWEQGNGAKEAYQADLGADWGGLSVDAVYAYDKDAVKLGLWGTKTVPATPDTLTATLADVNAGVIAAKYKWQALTLFGGYEYARLSTPSGLGTSIPVGDTYTLNGGYPGVIQGNAFVNPEDLQVLWVGGKYGLLSNLDVVVGYYHEWQNTYDATPDAVDKKTGTALFATTNCGPNAAPPITGAKPLGTEKGDCAGTTDAVSGMLDWRPVKRVDLYTGVMYSVVEGGMASGFIKDNNTAWTSGVRVSF